jgi:hypothetical protein
MTIAKISGQGLTSLAILVALLWACVIGERVISRRARTSAAETIEAMRNLRNQNRPARSTAPVLTPHARPKFG